MRPVPRTQLAELDGQRFDVAVIGAGSPSRRRLDRNNGSEGARTAAEAVANILDWDESRVEQEIEDYLIMLSRRHGMDES
jgi:hypothetical protein